MRGGAGMMGAIHDIIVDRHAATIILDDPRSEHICRGAEIEHFRDQGRVPVESGIGERIPQFRRKPVEAIELPFEPGQHDLRRADLCRDPPNERPSPVRKRIKNLAKCRIRRRRLWPQASPANLSMQQIAMEPITL